MALLGVGLGLYVAPKVAPWFRRRFGPAKPNIVLISIDTCRADFLSCYDSSRKTTPGIGAFARTATLFENAVSPVPITTPAHSSMLTGCIPPVHGVRRNRAHLAGSITTLAEMLKPHGYTTGAIVSAFVLDRQFGLDQGFDSYDDRFRTPGGGVDAEERVGEGASAAAIEWLRRQKDGDKFFLFLHYFDPHWPYEAPEPFASRFEEAYAAEVAYTDHCVGQVLAELGRLRLFEDALVIMTADHGEMLGEHGERTHRFFIYESAVKVPLIVKLPGQREARRVEDVVGLVDLVPTVCSLAGLPEPNVDGIDLTPYLKGEGPPPGARDRYLYSESFHPRLFGANPLFGQVGRRWKYIHTTRPELYDLSIDREEKINLVEVHPHRARLLESRLKAVLAGAAGAKVEGERVVLDEEARRRLESLGYVGVVEGDAIEFDDTREDPKDVIRFHTAVQRAAELRWDGEYDEIVRILRRVVEERPDTLVAHVLLADALGQLGRYQEAVEHFTAAIRLDPDDPIQYAQRGAAYEALGDEDRALADYTEALRRTPIDPRIYFRRARLLANRGDVAAAVADLEKVKEMCGPGSEGWAAADGLLRDLSARRGLPEEERRRRR